MNGLSSAVSRTRAHSDNALVAHALEEGSAAHRHPLSEAMMRGPEAARNVADAVHHMCLLHGRHPGVIDHAAARETDAGARDLLASLADSFSRERDLLAKLAVAVGPLPSTPGQANSEAAVLAQHHAVVMLAQSERRGCACGSALAVVIDWLAIRPVLDSAARRLGLDGTETSLPDLASIDAAVAALETNPAVERAMMFGAQQIIAQHSGLWDLLEARCAAREYANH